MTSVDIPEEMLQQWRARTVDLGGGHLGWTGSRWIRYEGRTYRGARLAFMIRTGREPVGRVMADCGMEGCVTPEHVEDLTGRQRSRVQFRAVMGLPDMPERCVQDHDQAEYGRVMKSGRRYCHACQVMSTTAFLGNPEHSGFALQLQARYEAGETIRQIADDVGRSYGYVRNLLVSVNTTFRARRAAA